MHAYYDNTNFHNIHIESTAGKFMGVLERLVSKYDDGQGREYDILDGELDTEWDRAVDLEELAKDNYYDR